MPYDQGSKVISYNNQVKSKDIIYVTCFRHGLTEFQAANKLKILRNQINTNFVKTDDKVEMI